MKKLIFQIIFCVSVLMVFSLSAYALPFTDTDYLREDFSINDYKDYLEWATDAKNPKWSNGAQAIISKPSPNYGEPSNFSAEIPESVEIIGSDTFYNRSLPQEAFDFTKMKNLKLIESNSFFGNRIFRIDLSQTSVVRIKTNAFYPHNCFQSIFIAPKTLKRIDSQAFSYAPFENITLNEGLEYIGDSVFKGNYNYALIPASVKHIGSQGLQTSGKTYRVYKGSYAEEWCKSNGVNYVYEEDIIAKINSLQGKTVKLGPVTFEGTTFCYIAEDKYGIPEYKVYLINGGSITTNYDNMNLILNRNLNGKEWILTEGMYGLTDNFFGTSTSYPIKMCLTDKGIIPTPSIKNSDGTWSKGLKWTFEPNPGKIGGAHIVIVKRGGREYRYHVMIRNEQVKYGSSPYIARLSTAPVYINGVLSNLSAYNIDGYNCFKLRDLAMALNGTSKQFNVSWNQSLGQINLISSTPYSPVGGELIPLGKKENDALRTFAQILKDGYEEVALPYNIDGNNYYKLRDIGRIFNFSIIWDRDNNRVLIDTNSPYTK